LSENLLHNKNGGSITIPGWVWSMLTGMLIGSALVGVGVFGASKPAPQWATSEMAGDEAPAFSLRTLDGETFRLEEHRGEVVILNFWATWCPPCREEMPGFVDLQDSFREEGVQFVGIAVDRDGATAVRPFVEKRDVNFPQIANPSVGARHFPGEGGAHVRDRQAGPHPLQPQRRAADVGATGRAGDAGETSP
jgi:thiol-disulfide isomerase/thioredoxin